MAGIKPGPAGIPAAVKEAGGNPGKRQIPSEPELEIGAPEMPADFAGEPEQAIWESTVGKLAEAGILRTVDELVLYEYCSLFAEVQRINARLKSDGLMIGDKKGSLKKHPLVTVRNQNLGRLARCRSELGLSPAARVGLGKAAPGGQGFLPFGPSADPEMFGVN